MIAPQDISTTYGQMGVQNEVIAINGDYYYITKVPPQSEFIDKITPLLEDDEIISEPGFYVYVIVSNPENSSPMLFAKRIISSQEIQTKHNDLLSDIGKHGINITQLYYAGEMIVEMDRDREHIHIKFNFLSGTYMSGIINPDDPQEHSEQVINIFKDKFKSDKITYEYVPGITSFITNANIPLTLESIEDFLQSGAEILKLRKEDTHDIFVAGDTESIKLNKVKNIILKSKFYPSKVIETNRRFDALAKYIPAEKNEENRQKALKELADQNIFERIFQQLQPQRGGSRRRKVVSRRRKVVSRRRKVVSRRRNVKKNKKN